LLQKNIGGSGEVEPPREGESVTEQRKSKTAWKAISEDTINVFRGKEGVQQQLRPLIKHNQREKGEFERERRACH